MSDENWILHKTKIPIALAPGVNAIIGFINFRVCGCQAMMGVQTSASAEERAKEDPDVMNVFFAGQGCHTHEDLMKLVGIEFANELPDEVSEDPDVVQNMFGDFEERFEKLIEPVVRD